MRRKVIYSGTPRSCVDGGTTSYSGYSSDKWRHISYNLSFDLIFFNFFFLLLLFFLTDIVKYPCFSTSPENLLPVFVGLWETISGYVSLHFPAFALDLNRRC